MQYVYNIVNFEVDALLVYRFTGADLKITARRSNTKIKI